MFTILHSKFIKLLLAGCIISASVPNTEIAAFGFFSKSDTTQTTFFKALAGVAVVAFVGLDIWYLVKKFIEKREKEEVEEKNRQKQGKKVQKKEKNENELEPANQTVARYTFDQWKKKCDKLPTYSPDNYEKKALNINEFVGVIVEFAQVLKGQLFNKNNWVGQPAFSDEDFNVEKYKAIGQGNCNFTDKFFVQKLDLPKDAKIFMHADIHSDVHSLVKYLDKLKKDGVIDDNFEIKDKRNYTAFFGDYTDRGNYGAEVLYTVARLKIANPENVLLLRGNHEDLLINEQFGFFYEIYNKFKLDEKYLKYLLTKLYNLLPCAVFTCILPEDQTSCKKEYSILCHAGIEPRFDPKELLKTQGNCLFQTLNLDGWIDENLKKRLSGIYQQGDLDHLNGFCWNEFHDKIGINVDSCGIGGRGGLIVKNNIVEEYLWKCSSEKDGYFVNRIFKGHQHSDEMLKNMIKYGGIYNICGDDNCQWDKESECIELSENHKPVWILNVSPDSAYGLNENYFFDHYSVLKKKSKSNCLLLEPHKVEVLGNRGKLII